MSVIHSRSPFLSLSFPFLVNRATIAAVAKERTAKGGCKEDPQQPRRTNKTRGKRREKASEPIYKIPTVVFPFLGLLSTSIAASGWPANERESLV
jgi:hypothetical protein